MIKQARIIICTLLMACGVAMGQSHEGDTVAGTFLNGHYTNRSLGFSFRAPAKWITPDKEQFSKYVKEGTATYRTGKPSLDNAAGRHEKIEFVISEKAMGETENAVLGYSLTKQQNLSFTPKMIAEATRAYFLQVPAYTNLRDISVERLGNRDFMTFEAGVVDFPKQRVRMYFTRIDEYALTFALTYWSDKELKIMLDSLNSIKFDRQ
jgi:hypothetical protein